MHFETYAQLVMFIIKTKKKNMLIDIATANPPYKVTQEYAASELKKRMGGSPSLSRMIDIAAAYSGIDNRYIVIPDGESGDYEKLFTKNGEHFSPDTKTRMMVYEKWAVDLSVNAVSKLIDRNNVDPGTIKKIITISCTGFFAPGLDYEIINHFNLPANIKREHIGFMGCAASLVGVNSVWDSLNNSGSDVLLISVELCSLHLQTEISRDNILANMIFADGAAAAYFSKNNFNSKRKLDIIHTSSVLFHDSAKYMGWKIGNHGFEMLLSSELPKIILNTAAPEIIKILKSKGYEVNDIKHWALHPGGRAILDSLQNGLHLSDQQLIPSRNTLSNFGNLSSVSILFVIKYIMENSELRKDDLCCAVAFGPGLTMELVIFKTV